MIRGRYPTEKCKNSKWPPSNYRKIVKIKITVKYSHEVYQMKGINEYNSVFHISVLKYVWGGQIFKKFKMAAKILANFMSRLKYSHVVYQIDGIDK